jgi:hypothetical protein
VKRAENEVSSFRGGYAFLSNFHPATVLFEGHPYRSVEHAFQAAKTRDRGLRRAIREAPTAGEAKKLGRRVPLRRDWEGVNYLGLKAEALWPLTQPQTFVTELQDLKHPIIVRYNRLVYKQPFPMQIEGQTVLSRCSVKLCFQWVPYDPLSYDPLACKICASEKTVSENALSSVKDRRSNFDPWPVYTKIHKQASPFNLQRRALPPRPKGRGFRAEIR